MPSTFAGRPERPTAAPGAVVPGAPPIGKRVPSAAARLGLALATLALVAGCGLTQPAPAKDTFLVQFGPVPAAAARAWPATLRIGNFGVVAPFDGRGLVYRTSEYTFVSDFYNEYFVAPGPMIRDRVATYLTHARPFETIAIDSQVPARYHLRGVVTQMVGDVRDKAAPAAVLAIHFYLVPADTPSDRVLLDRVIEQRVAIRDGSAGALVEGLSRALEATLATLTRELVQLDLAAEPPVGSGTAGRPRPASGR